MTHLEMTNYFHKMIESDKISHAILVDGVTCEEDKEPVYSFIKKIMGSLDCEDIIFLSHEKERTITVKEVEEQVTSMAAIKPYAREHRIFVIDEAEKMNPAAQNKLLKTLEEPPAYVIIILLTPNANMLIETVRSRCQILSITTESDEVLEGELAETYMKYAAIFASLSDLEAYNISKTIVDDIKKGAERKNNRITYEMLFTFLRNIYRDALALSQGYDKMLMPKQNAASKKLSGLSEKTLLRSLEAIDKAEYNITREVNKELTIREMILNMKG